MAIQAATAERSAERSKHTGRVPKLTPEIQKLFIETLRLTGNYRAAANRCAIDPATPMTWKAKGETQVRGIYRDFREACIRTLGERVTLSAGIHYRVSHGQIYKAPLRKREFTPRGDLIETNELALDKEGRPIFVDVCDAPDLKAIEWELARIDPETYALKPGGVTVNSQTNVEVGLTLVDVLDKIGPLA
jgi:hypothetical protein